MRMRRNVILDRRDFAEFLRDRADAPVGMARSSDDCPLARFLMEKTGVYWYVSARGCYPDPNSDAVERESKLGPAAQGFNTPRWARDFIHVLDREFRGIRSEVIGAEAWSILVEAVR